MKKNTNSKKNNAMAPPREVISRAMELWGIYNAIYSTAVESYRALLERKRELKIRPLNKIPDHILREYPDIPFLKIGKPDEAQAYLEKLNVAEVSMIIHHIEYMIEYDHAYRTVTNRVREYEYQIKYHHQKNPYAVDPSCVSVKGLRNRSNGRNVRIDESK